MHSQDAIDLVRQALLTALLISAPVLATGLVVGLIVGLIQALTQIQDQTLAFVPKLVAMILVLSFTLPWLITHLAEYARELVENIPRAL